MKILALAHALRAGGGRATCTNILNALAALDRDNDYYLIVPDQPEYRALNLERHGHKVHYYRRRLGHFGRWWFDAFTLKRIARRYQPDVIWGMGSLGLSDPPCPQAISIQNPYLVYDVRRTGRLGLMDRLRLFFLRHTFRRSVNKSSLVFCQTATMESRLKDAYGFEGKTVVISKAVSGFAAAGSATIPDVLAEYEGKTKLFYLTRYYPHKGLEMLVETMDRYRDELSDIVAVITIEPGQHPAAAQLLNRIDRRGLRAHVVNVGQLAQHELAGYYAACDALVMPTRLESFSGTYLEAMHFGMPILTSNLDFAREACGDAALYFDPWDAASIRDAILRIKSDPDLRANLVTRGKKRLSESYGRTWNDIAQSIVNELRSLHLNALSQERHCSSIQTVAT